MNIAWAISRGFRSVQMTPCCGLPAVCSRTTSRNTAFQSGWSVNLDLRPFFSDPLSSRIQFFFEYLQPLPDCFRVNVKQFRNIFETAMAQLVRLHSRIPTSVLLRQPHVQLLHPRFNLSPITSLHRLSSRMTASYQRRFAPARSTSGSYFSLVPKAQGNDTASGDWSFVSAVDGQKQW